MLSGMAQVRFSHPDTTPLPAAHRLSDLVGADVGLHVGQNFLDAFPFSPTPCP